jgi:cation:H+ antiporter
VGSILAAVGTAMPETIIPIIAIVFTSGTAAHDVGIGAIAGAPFMLSTLAFFVTGAAVVVYTLLGKRTLHMDVDSKVISKDLLFFIAIYGIAVLTTFVHTIIWLKTAIAVILVLSYGVYLKQVVSHDGSMLENVDQLYLKKFCRLPDNKLWISIQLIAALIIMIFGAHLFIKYVQLLSFSLGIAPLILSLIITPIATELPEKLNSIIWVGRKKETLAVGNITGAMVFQSCFPVAFGIICTPWALHGITVVSAVLALSGALINLLWLKLFKRLNPFVLMFGGVLYGVFIAYLIWGKT